MIAILDKEFLFYVWKTAEVAEHEFLYCISSISLALRRGVTNTHQCLEHMNKYLFLLFAFISFETYGQYCNCEQEFLYIKGFIEKNYAGFKDKQEQMTDKGYSQIVKKFQNLSKSTTAKENCLLIIAQYLDSFKDQHIQISPRFDATKNDTGYINQRTLIPLSEKKLAALSKSKGKEGIYQFRHDSSYKIAVFKDRSALHDYIGVVVDSKLPTWKRGHLKFEAKQINDSVFKGVLYMRNHMPKIEYFDFGKDRIAGDWQREGTAFKKISYNYIPVSGQKLSDKTLYLKISSFSGSNAKNIDSLFKAHAATLSSTPNLIIDLRDNGGGSDFSFTPILPYIYTHPVKGIGVDVLATESNITGWKKVLENKDLPEQNRAAISNMIAEMELNKGKLVNIASDYVDSSYQPLPNPKKVLILINRGCASTTEQFLLYARQSSKVILAGEPTQGVLDYSNMRDAPFSCMSYVLRYATTRSRRLDVGEGIDNIGIKPQIKLERNGDWIKQARKIIEAQ